MTDLLSKVLARYKTCYLSKTISPFVLYVTVFHLTSSEDFHTGNFQRVSLLKLLPGTNDEETALKRQMSYLAWLRRRQVPYNGSDEKPVVIQTFKSEMD